MLLSHDLVQLGLWQVLRDHELGVSIFERRVEEKRLLAVRLGLIEDMLDHILLHSGDVLAPLVPIKVLLYC